MMEQNPFPVLRRRREKEETSSGTRAGTRRNQEIIVEENLFPEKRKKSEEADKHRNPIRNQKEPENYDGTEFFLEKENGEDRTQSQQSEPEPGGTTGHHDGTEPFSGDRKE